jgi:sugar/nucleoside kinase (ribokinase family)
VRRDSPSSTSWRSARGELVAGVKQFADRITTTYGGPATTAAAAAARLGVDVELVVALGDDERGARCARARERGVGTGCMVVRDGAADRDVARDRHAGR